MEGAGPKRHSSPLGNEMKNRPQIRSRVILLLLLAWLLGWEINIVFGGNITNPPAPPPLDASYVVLGTSAGLSDERVLTGTANQITVTDAGAGSTVTLSLPQNVHTGATPTFATLTLVSPSANTTQLTLSGYSLTGSNAAPLVDLAGTWNTSGAPSAITLNITNTASDGAARLIDLRVGGSPLFYVQVNGATYFSGNLTVAGLFASGDLGAGATRDLYWSGRSLMQSPVNGNIVLKNVAGTDFGLLMFGGTTASFPALKRSTTSLLVRLADDSGYGGFDALAYSAGGVAGLSQTKTVRASGGAADCTLIFTGGILTGGTC